MDNKEAMLNISLSDKRHRGRPSMAYKQHWLDNLQLSQEKKYEKEFAKHLWYHVDIEKIQYHKLKETTARNNNLLQKERLIKWRLMDNLLIGVIRQGDGWTIYPLMW